LMARLAALVPPPRMHFTRFHGVFAPTGPDSPRKWWPLSPSPEPRRDRDSLSLYHDLQINRQ
jgi:hypothetical protein